MTRRGFTLIELLVVIAIVGVLFTLSLVSFSAARRQSRDARRKADLEMIRSGLEIYKSDCNIYPAASEVIKSTALEGTVVPPSSCSTANIYISSVPADPLDPNRLYTYSRPTTTTYILCASLEDASLPAVSGCSSSCGTPCNYKVTNP